MARHYALAPSLWRSQGEGWGGVGFSPPDAAVASRLTPLLRVTVNAPCRAWLGTTLLLPPFGKAKGRVGEGLAFRRLMQLWLRGSRRPHTRRERPLPSMAWHYAVAPSLWRSQGEGWGGVGFSPPDAAAASRLTPLLRVTGTPLAEHGSALRCRSLPLAKPRGGLGRGWPFAA